jgi:hypothetical protein
MARKCRVDSHIADNVLGSPVLSVILMVVSPSALDLLCVLGLCALLPLLNL